MGIQLRDWRADHRNTRRGFISIIFPEIGLTIRDVVVHCFAKDGQEERWWFAMPAREYTDREGAKKWWAFILFEKDANDRLQQALERELRSTQPQLFAGDPETSKPVPDQAVRDRLKDARPSQRAVERGIDAQRPLNRSKERPRETGRSLDDEIPF